jgi:imidazolonepropionase-like amidohydrolase
MRAARLEYESSIGGEQRTCMRIRTLLQSLQVAALLSIAVIPGQSQAADDVERSVHLRYGQPNGFQEVRHNTDGSISVHFEYNDRGRGPKFDAQYRLAADGTLLQVDSEGVDYLKAPLSDHFLLVGGQAHWHNTAENEQRAVSAPVFYKSFYGPSEEMHLLVQALLKAPGQKLNLLPGGEVSLRKIDKETVHGKAGTRSLFLYALSGFGAPLYFWQGAGGHFFVDSDSVVPEGWEDILPQLHKSEDAQDQKLRHDRAMALTRHLEQALAIEHVRVFDPDRLTAKAGQTVLVSAGHITAIGDDGRVAIPKQAQRLDGHDRFLMAGLWDMHQHLHDDAGLLDLAAGITTVRDMGNPPDNLAQLIDGYESGADIGPRVIKAGLMDGRGQYQSRAGIYADTAEEAVKDVDFYADHGYVQAKIYSSIKPELVPVIVKEAHARGMRVSGHVPAFMTAEQFVNDGVDEIQHINFLFLNFFFDQVQDTRTPARFTVVAQHGAELDLSSPRVRGFIDLLRQHHIVCDPTVADFEAKFLSRPGVMAPTYGAMVDRLTLPDQRSTKGGADGLPVPPGMDARHRESFERMVQMIGVLYRSGVTIVAGTDGLGFIWLPREFELYVNAGISPAEVLRLDTLGAARVMKRDNEYGRIAPGYVSDLILVDGDPTINISDIRKVRTVLRGDRLYDSAALFQSMGVAPAP